MRDATGLIAVCLLFGGPMLVWLISTIADAIVRVNCHTKDTQLKMRLAKAGMSAEDIERIVLAGRGVPAFDEEAEEEAPKAKKGGPTVPAGEELAWDK